IGERVYKDSIRHRAVDPQRLSIWRDADAVGRSTCLRCSACGFIGHFNPSHYFMGLKVHHRKPVKTGKLDEDSTCRTVVTSFEGHGAYSAVEWQLPDRL